MTQVEKANKFIMFTVVGLDIIAINVLFIVFQFVWKKLYNEQMFEGEIIPSLTLLTISYIVGSALSGVVLYHRRIRNYQVIISSMKNMVAFFVVWLAISSINIPQPFFTKAHTFFFIISTIIVTASRLTLHYFIMLLRQSGNNQCRVVYLGSTHNMRELYDEMSMRITTGYKVMGYFDEKPNPKCNEGCKYLGKNSEALDYIKKNSIDRLYCGLTSNYGEEIIVPIINYCESHLIRFYSVPNLRNYFKKRVNLEMFSNVPLLSIHSEPLSLPINNLIKRIFDVIVSGVFVFTIYPFIFLIIAPIIKLTSPGNIYFTQKRHGLDGKEFNCMKFRTMHVNKSCNDVQATKDDPRKTKFGDFLRRTSLDELPQFINVLRGEMSIVGPRPHMVKHTQEYSELIDTYMVRHYIKPGITGWAQVTGFRGETKVLADMEGRIKADIWYIEHWTFMLDIYIMFKTAINVIAKKDKNAY